MKKKKLRKMGDILLDLEPLLFEMQDHGMQMGDVLSLVQSWILVHAPDMVEVYVEDESSPFFYYGHKDGFQQQIKKPKSESPKTERFDRDEKWADNMVPKQVKLEEESNLCRTCKKNKHNFLTYHCNSCIYGDRLFKK